MKKLMTVFVLGLMIMTSVVAFADETETEPTTPAGEQTQTEDN